MIGKLIVLLAAALPLMGSPGPATLSLASLGAAFGFRRSLSYLFGIIAGTIGVLLIIATGVTGVLAAQPALLILIQIAAAAYIVLLAWKIATAPVSSEPIGDKGTSGLNVVSFLPGFALAIANPKAFAAIGAVYAGHEVVPEQVVLDATLKVAALALVVILVNTAWLAFGTTFSRMLTDPTIGRVVNIAFAVLLLVSVGGAFLLG